MPEQLPSSPPWDLIAKKRAGQASATELAAIELWMAQVAQATAEGSEQIDVTFEDGAAMAAWLRMQQRAKRRPAGGTN